MSLSFENDSLSKSKYFQISMTNIFLIKKFFLNYLTITVSMV